MKRLIYAIAAALLFAAPSAALTIGDLGFRGPGVVQADIRGRAMTVYTYVPDCAYPDILFSFHGSGRNADDYRDRAQVVADRECMIVLAPEFPYGADGWYNWQYNRGGIYYDGVLYPEDEWTPRDVEALVDWARTIEGASDLVWLFGHSAGGQALSRVAAFSPALDVERIIIANPSTHVWPSLDEAVPYGFGGFGSDVMSEALLKSYLAAPVTIYLGGDDTGSQDLATGEEADRQGIHRLDRGLNVYAAAEAEAATRGWHFGWRLVVAGGVGHSSSGMLRDDAMADAMLTDGDLAAIAAAEAQAAVDALVAALESEIQAGLAAAEARRQADLDQVQEAINAVR